MVYLTKKKIKGKIYLYIEERAWIDGKSRRTWQKYLGPEEKIKELEISGILSKGKPNIRVKSIEFGISAATWKIADEIGLINIIDGKINKSRDQNLSVGAYLVIAAINRCVAPCSKSKLANWFEGDWLSTRFDIEPSVLNAQTYWNHFRYLDEESINTIEIAINKIILDKYNLDTDSLFFDPTNFYTFSKNTDPSELRQYGHSKEGRNNLRIVSYSLVCLKDLGIPLMHETYPGNEQDAKAFKRVPEMVANRLKALGRKPGDITLVFDKGNHSLDAFKMIDKEGFKFIASARNSMFKDLLAIPSEALIESHLPVTGKQIKYHRTTKKKYGRERTVYVVLDPAKHEKHVLLFGMKIDNKVQEIREYFKDRLNHKKWKSHEAVEKKLKSMIGKKPLSGVVIARVEGEDGNMTLEVKIDDDARRKHENTLGRTILLTNQDDWNPESVIWGYREQYNVEHAFSRMKSPTSIAVRPMYHHSDDCIRAHVFTCVLALLLLSLLRLKLARKDVQASYDEILDSLGNLHLVSMNVIGKNDYAYKLEEKKGLTATITKKLGLARLVP